MAFFSIGMALYSEGSYEDVLARLTDGLSWASGWQEAYSPPSKSAICQARARLGSEPLAALCARVARPIGAEQTSGVWLGGRRLVAIDGTCLDVADTVANSAHFGRPGVNKGEQAAFPQAMVVALAECGTHAVFAAEIGTYSQSEATLNGPLLDRLEPGMLLPADRTPAAERAQEPMLVRVIGHTVDDGRENPTTYSLFTALLDPAQASAVDLAVAHTRRWEIELTFDGLKTHQRGPRTVLRSKSPDLVLQENWVHLCER